MESSSAGVPGGPQPCDLLIAGGILLTLNAERLIITDAAVAITGPRITAVGKRTDLAPRFAPARTIDGLITVFEASRDAFGGRTALNLPALTVRVQDMLDALEALGGRAARERVLDEVGAAADRDEEIALLDAA